MKKCQSIVGYAQIDVAFKKPEKNLEKILKIVKKYDFDLIVFPELALSGYDFKNKKELLNFSFEREDKIFDEISNICKTSSKIVVLGFSEKSDGKIFNSSLLIDEKGKRYVYRKTHLFYRETILFEKGDTGFFVKDCKGIKIGMMICFDWIFPESSRSLSLKGCDIIAHPSNLVLPYCQDAMITRSLENRVYSITSNRLGGEGTYHFTGKSQIVSPQGIVLSRASAHSEKVSIVEIDLNLSRNKKINRYNDIFKCRRKDFYEC